MNLSNLDIFVFVLYCLIILFIGLYVSREKEGKAKSAEDYFLAGKSLPWWAIGASLIAANISAEQFVAMNGSGFAAGLAIASYEWMAAITLLVVGKYFLPIFIEKGLYTIPEFIEKRFSTNLKTILAIFWIALFVFVNLTTVLFLGAKALDIVIGTGDGSLLFASIIGLGLFAAAYSLWGGLAAVAWTDVIVGGMWVANLYYWGFNQYIIQRTLAAKNLKEGQKGIAFAAFLKLLMPVIVVVPGIVAYVMNMDAGVFNPETIDQSFVGENGMIANDNAAPWLIKNFIPAGFLGLILAALAAAIVSSLASMLNSTSTIFTMDIYKSFINKEASDKSTVRVGRITALVSLIIAMIIAPQLGSLGEVFQFIQEYTGVVSPGILAVFLMGLFYKKATNNAAIWGVISSIPVAMYFKIVPSDWFLAGTPFMNQMGITCLSTIFIIYVISYLEGNKDNPKGITLSKKLFETSSEFNISAMVICIITAFLYAFLW